MQQILLIFGKTYFLNIFFTTQMKKNPPKTNFSPTKGTSINDVQFFLVILDPPSPPKIEHHLFIYGRSLREFFFLPTRVFCRYLRGGVIGPKIFCAGPNFLSQSKNLIAFFASSKTFVPAQKLNLLNGNHLLIWHKMLGTGTKCI